MKKIIASAVILYTLNGCSWFGVGEPPGVKITKVEVTLAIKAAERANKRAAAIGHQWRDTDKLIKNAKTADSKGELEKAYKLAKEAEEQGLLAEQQGIEQKNAGPAF